ncbi:hypothetical protein Hanom_Chr06g00496601 [Helianthus anomalus]
MNNFLEILEVFLGSPLIAPAGFNLIRQRRVTSNLLKVYQRTLMNCRINFTFA